MIKSYIVRLQFYQTLSYPIVNIVLEPVQLPLAGKNKSGERYAPPDGIR